MKVIRKYLNSYKGENRGKGQQFSFIEKFTPMSGCLAQLNHGKTFFFCHCFIATISVDKPNTHRPRRAAHLPPPTGRFALLGQLFSSANDDSIHTVMARLKEIEITPKKSSSHNPHNEEIFGITNKKCSYFPTEVC